MRSVFLAVVLHGSILAVFVVFLLWNGGYFDKQELRQPVTSGAALPVVPVLRAGYGPGDPIYDEQVRLLRAGVFACVGGYIARPLERDGGRSYAVIQTDRGPLACP